jgi:hypothetical protein
VSRAPPCLTSCLTRCYLPQPQLGGQAQTSQPHALPQQQRAASARSTRSAVVWQAVQAQVAAAHGAQEQEVVVELVMGSSESSALASRRRGGPGTGPRSRERRSS